MSSHIKDTYLRTIDMEEKQLDLLGNAAIGRAVTATLRVSPNGDGTDGLTWRTAYQTPQDALEASSLDGDDCTLILISPHATHYDIDTTGDPTWAANVIIKGTHRNWANIMNNHAGATSVMGFTSKVSLMNITIDCGVGSNNGVIITGANASGARLECVYFECENVTGAQTALELSGNIEYAKLDNVMVHGVVAH